MEAEKKEIAFVVRGREVIVDVDPSGPMGDGVRLALEKLGIDAGPDMWNARTVEGRVLNMGKSPIEEGVGKLAKIYLDGGPDATKIKDITGLRERRNVEFKESTPWTNLRCVLTRTIMAMANLKGGGRIIIGVKEDSSKTPVPVGMTKEDIDSYNQDDISSFVNEYAEPSVVVVPHKRAYGGKEYVILDVEEFDEVPIVCKKDGRKSCEGHLRRGSIYHRPRRKVESTDRFDYADMRELVDLAAIKQHKVMHEQCAELYGTASGAPSRAPGPVANPRGAKYDKEGGGF